MRWDEISAVSAFATMLVIAPSAIAALVQLNHLRRSNQLSGLISVLELFQDAHFHELIDFTRSELPGKLADAAFRAGLRKVPVDRRGHPELHVAEMHEEIGSYVRSGLVDENLFLQGRWYNVILYWSLLRPCIEIVRGNRPHTFENFELLAARAIAWRARHPLGNYPASVPRVDAQAVKAALANAHERDISRPKV
jgi:hypothetical protein